MSTSKTSGAIYRIYRKTRDFTQIDNSILRSRDLSLRAKGLLTLLLSFSENFAPSNELLLEFIQEGPTALRSGRKELVMKGHAIYRRERLPSGQFRSYYDIYEVPIELGNTGSTGCRNTACGKTACGRAEFGDSAPNKRLDVIPTSQSVSQQEKSWWGRSVDDWIDRLRESGLNPKRSGDGWTALCPCHEDSKPSLSVRSGSTRAVVAKCHAGCPFEDIAFFLFSEPLGESPAYTYTLADDTPAFRVIRNAHSKTFTVQSFVNGRWVKGMRKRAPQVPYRLPQLIRGISEAREIWIVEGEKDAEYLRRSGAIGTCNALGAGKWSCGLNEYFKGAKVTIVADKDQAGIRHAFNVLDQLQPIVSSARVVIAAGDLGINDLTDHFGAGYKFDDFIEIDPSYSLAEAGRLQACSTTEEQYGN